MKLALQKRVIVLTGAAGGIGAALAEALAGKGANLALVDRNEAGLHAVAEKARDLGSKVSTYTIDLAERSALRELPAAVGAELGEAAVLINNAGMALAGSFEQVSAERFEQLFAVNFFAAVELCRGFLPQLRHSAPAQIVNLSSVFGLAGCAGQVAYSASKSALRGFSESLRAELASANVGVSLVHPGGVRTGIALAAMVEAGLSPEQIEAVRGAAEKPLRLDPHAAAARIVEGLERREKRILVGSDAKFVAWMQRLMPVGYSRFMPGAGGKA